MLFPSIILHLQEASWFLTPMLTQQSKLTLLLGEGCCARASLTTVELAGTEAMAGTGTLLGAREAIPMLGMVGMEVIAMDVGMF